MNFKTDLPQIAALRNRVEDTVGFQMKTHNDFVLLVDIIERQLKEHMSETTLERVWGYSTRGYESVSSRTLNVLSQLAGYTDWNDFTRQLHTEAHKESEMFFADTIDSSSLPLGTKLRIGWLPDRICEIRYLGNNRFIAEKTENSSIKPGDSFSCLLLQKGRELYMDYFCRKGENPNPNDRYVVGQQNGLTMLEIIS
jgi:hypothetical protein